MYLCNMSTTNKITTTFVHIYTNKGRKLPFMGCGLGKTNQNGVYTVEAGSLHSRKELYDVRGHITGWQVSCESENLDSVRWNTCFCLMALANHEPCFEV